MFGMATGSIEHVLYKENIPTNYLSKTFQSSVLYTPADTTRRTISTENYLRQVAKDFHQAKTPWGRHNSYGGRSFIHLKGTPTCDDMVIIAKGSQHFGSGINSKPRGVTVQHQYNITPLMKSNLRPNDELIGCPTKVDVIRNHQIDAKFPAEHPYTSHIPKTEMFPPSMRTKSQQISALSTPGKSSQTPEMAPLTPASTPSTRVDCTGQAPEYVHPADSPASAHDAIILSKTRGSPYRHELLSIPLDSQRKPMTWPQGPTYFQMLKGPDRERNVYYPTPKSQLDLNSSQFQKLSASTQRVLQEVNKSQWKTTYGRDFSQLGQHDNHVNLDTEKTLKTVTRLPTAEIPSRLLNSNVQELKEPKVPRTVEELTGESARQKTVHFIDSRISNTCSQDKSNEKLRFSRPLYKGVRPYTSIGDTSNITSNLMMTSRSQSAVYTNEFKDLQFMRSSKTDLQRKFNSNHTGAEVPDLRGSRDIRTSLLERRHQIPEASGTKSHIFNGL